MRASTRSLNTINSSDGAALLTPRGWARRPGQLAWCWVFPLGVWLRQRCDVTTHQAGILPGMGLGGRGHDARMR